MGGFFCVRSVLCVLHFPCCFIGVEQYKSAPLEAELFLERKGTEMGERCSAPARHEKRTTRRNKSAPLEVKIFLEGKGT